MTPAERWVEEVAGTVRPDRVVWCDGSGAEKERLREGMLADGTLIRLHPQKAPGCTLHRSHPSDVARTEHLTFIASRTREDAGPTNNWMAPDEARKRVGPLFSGVMKGRTMYVVPYLMAPPGSSFSKVGIEVTDSPYVVANMEIMTRMGRVALDQLGGSEDFVPGLHSTGDLSIDRRYIVHFPEERLIWSVGSGYGGNALLGKKCFALRIASRLARDQGWLAEHMLILELTLPDGETHYVAAAFPSACGKTNLAMLVSPFEAQGYRVRTVGDDIAWLRPGEDGRLWAVNPEAGFFGVVPGTGPDTNPNAMATITHDTIFTNVAVTPDGIPWWEGKDKSPPADLIDWQGKRWDGSGKAAHPNSRFTVAARQCPSISPRWEDPGGVPLSAIVFGGRRARVTPLVIQSRDWAHGVFLGATLGSETTAAATGKVGVVRRDPMAMLPFCGYNMADYFRHWLHMGAQLRRPPAIFQVNWFRTGDDGRLLWPGFGQNLRVLLWMIERVKGTGAATDTPVGLVPAAAALNWDGLDLSAPKRQALLRVDRSEWAAEVPQLRAFFDQFGDRVPGELNRALAALSEQLTTASV
ncbi:MAG TPA: phosphoenolpyruvate carboxykinase (GTP) [Vicinamibacteria bacterium]|jgi:phosphoenolpyruvate carboxykinase (GTP)|nr:phosphoenolpyruvate carboxykinase (GTP) [Vicinamibacteria bacterium]